jgi:mono/diheme cytochrome c family protein
MTYCAACHQRDGEGAPPRFPPVAVTDWVTGDKQRLISVIINGLEGPIVVRGETYNFPMPQHSFLSDEDVASVATFIRQNFGNDASEVTVEEVREFRSRMENENGQ